MKTGRQRSRSEARETVEATDARPVYRVDPAPLRLRDMPSRLRPREEMDRLGVRNVSDDVLLAVVLRSGIRGVNVLELARSLLQAYGSLTALAAAPVQELARRPGLGAVKAQVLAAALEIARRLGEEKQPVKLTVRQPSDVAELLREEARLLEREVFWVVLLDARNVVKGRPVGVTQGLLDASLVHPREVFRAAIRSAAAAVVLAHNHPSGDPAPSAEDIRITKQLVEAGRIIDIKVLDHVVLGGTGRDGRPPFLSMREEGLARFSER